MDRDEHRDGHEDAYSDSDSYTDELPDADRYEDGDEHSNADGNVSQITAVNTQTGNQVTQYVFGTSSKNPWKTFDELIAYAKANPGKLNYGSSGANLRLLVEAILQAQSLDVVHIPYNGGGPYVQALVVGDIQMGFVSASTVTSVGIPGLHRAAQASNRWRERFAFINVSFVVGATSHLFG